MTFSENNYYEAYKRIRNRLRKFKADSVFNGCILYLNQPKERMQDELNKQHWLAFLLIKWAYIDDQFNLPGKQLARNSDISQLLSEAQGLNSTLRDPSEYQSIYLFLRALANQQFLYQQPINLGSLVRERLFFAELPDNHTFQRLFKERTGLSANECSSLSITLLSFIEQSKKVVFNISEFRPLFGQETEKYVRSFLNLISVPTTGLRDHMRGHGFQKRCAEEFYEPPPFIEFPLVQNGDLYIVTYKALLYRALETFFYDFMRRNFMEQFMPKFGREIFESHINATLQHASLSFLTEDQLKKIVGAGKVVDFVINEDNANIFIDAKAVEARSNTSAVHSASRLSNSLQPSILKAIEQALETNARLPTDTANNIITRKPNNYIMVVTYKELYATNGKNLRDEIASEAYSKILDRFAPDMHIPAEHIYFLTVNDFDRLMEEISRSGSALSSILEAITERDNGVETRCFHFIQHLDALGYKELPKFLKQSLDASIENLQRMAFSSS